MRVSRVQPRPRHKGSGHRSVPKKILGTIYMRALHGMRNSNQTLHGDQTVLEEHFYRVDHVTYALVKNLCGTNADAQSLCGS